MAAYSIADLDPGVAKALETDLLAVADTKLVLGNWFNMCVHNGRSLPDFAALLGQAAAVMGHARSLYLYLVNFGHTYEHLEQGRGPEDIASMNLLDAPPESWEDFIASIYLAEQASWMLISGFLKHPDRALAGLAEKIGQETYFHLKYANGWAALFKESGGEAFIEALGARYPLALGWFGDTSSDPLHDAGQRTVPLSALKEGFVREVAKTVDIVGRPLELPEAVEQGSDWRPESRRNGPLSDRLYEVIRFKDAEAAHP
jgi:ring-1,2-phenylacetyl-CoA epoxidase subunit PaaC